MLKCYINNVPHFRNITTLHIEGRYVKIKY